MNIITLNGSDADHFATINYPDGQRSIILNLSELDVKKPVHIKCRIRNFNELEMMMCLVGALKRNDFYIQRIDYVYLFGMRSDRAFKPGEPNYFKDVVVPILKTFGEKKTYILAPHNQMILDLLDASILFSPDHDLSSITDFDHILLNGDENSSFLHKTFGKWTANYDFHFKKIRENSLINVKLDGRTLITLRKAQTQHIPILIQDDLCDAGGTFIGEAKYLRENGISNPLNLFVAHGLFTKGLEPLLEHFEHIYCTNSYQDIDHPHVTQIKVI